MQVAHAGTYGLSSYVLISHIREKLTRSNAYVFELTRMFDSSSYAFMDVHAML